MSTDRDSEILQRLENNDPFALTLILRDVVPVLWPLLAGRFRDSLSSEDIDDVVATSLAKLWHNRSKFDFSKGDLNGWFYVILRNSALDLLRRRAPKAEEFLTIVSNPDSTKSTPKEMLDVFTSVMAGFSDREKQVLLPLFDKSGPSVSQLSDSLSMSSGAVRQLRFRALRKLEKNLAEFGYVVRRGRRDVPADESERL
jgi:RNA polymerase sigma factor (sigma-70 family)